jgi:tetratricopeptide (TPR) repeat protein
MDSPDTAASDTAAPDTAALDTNVHAALAHGFPPGPALDRITGAWTGIRARVSDDQRALKEFDRILRRGNRAAQAAAFLDHLVAAMPAHSWPLVMAARNALESGAHRVAQRHAETLIARFAGQEDGYRLQAEALVQADLLVEAETAIAAARQRFGVRDWQLAATIALCHKRRDWPAALAAAEQLRDLAPRRMQGVAEIAVALSRLGRGQEAERVVLDALQRFPAKALVMKAAASVADYRKTFPKSRTGYVGALQILQKTRRLDLAADVLEESLARFPRDPKVLQLLAAIAAREGRWQEADAHWQKLVAMYPEKADFALAAALAPMGHRSSRRQRMPDILARLDGLHETFPDFAEGYRAHLSLLRDERLHDEAARRGQEWCARFPDNIELALALASVAEDGQHYDDALAQLTALRLRVPPHPMLEAAYVRVLSRALRDAEAESACLAALRAHPANRPLLSEYARIASRRGDWEEAHARWQSAQRRLPGDPQIAREIRQVAQELAGQADADAFAGTAAAENLFSRFESLGGTATGCEFGMVQRKFGSEGIGLLRWTRSSIGNLVDALNSNLEGVGEEQHTELLTVRFSADREEYVTADRRFGMKSNTFIKVSDAPYEKMFTQTCRRLRFLRNKLIEDLRAAEKIFVFKVQDPEPDAALRALYAAARRYGNVTLLCVREADAENRRGTIRIIEPGLFVGHIGYFIRAGDGGARGIDFVTWKTLAEEAENLRGTQVRRAEAA